MLVYLLLSTTVEALSLLAVVWVLSKKDLHREFNAFIGYLLAVATYDILYVLLRCLCTFNLLKIATAALLYSIGYNTLFVVQCFFIFLLVRDLYRHATAHLEGMERLGALIFYGSIIISAVMAFGAVASPHPTGYSTIALVLLQIERSSCILVLCLFTFFAFTAQKLGMTYGSRVFGVTFGMAILATDRLVSTALSWDLSAERWFFVNLVSEFVQIGAIALWMVYFLKEEPERRLVTVDMHSPLVRWNEVAQMLGNPAGRVVVSSPSTFIPAVHEVAHSATRTGPLPPPETNPAVAAAR